MIILQNHSVFGANNTAMVSSIETLYTNNTINLGITMFLNRYFPLTHNLKSHDNTYTFPTASGANIDPKTNSYKLTNTQGALSVDLTDLVSSDYLSDGYTVEFWFKLIKATHPSIKDFMYLGYANQPNVIGSLTAKLSVTSNYNGIQLGFQHYSQLLLMMI